MAKMIEFNKIAVQVIVHGLVQGVSFRAFTRDMAIKLNITGYTLNLPNGTVKVIALGTESSIQKLFESLKVGSLRAQVDKLELTYLNLEDIKESFNDFKIIR
jgi:acylphosphatase